MTTGRPLVGELAGGDKAPAKCFIDGFVVIAELSSKINGPEKLLWYTATAASTMSPLAQSFRRSGCKLPGSRFKVSD